MTVPLKKLRDVAQIVMGTSPKGNTYNAAGEGLPLLNGPTEFGERHPECTSFTSASVKECEAGDLIFCVRGSTTGRMNWADKVYSLGRGVCAIRGVQELETKFIRYCLDYRLPALLQLAGGTTFPNLPQDTIKDFEIPYPTNRREIADLLSAYDDLMENNRRRMGLLEEAARLLYREWFVRLRFPGHEHNRVTKGVPDGWERVAFEDALVLQRGFDLPERDWQEGDFPICGSTGIIGHHKEPKVIGPGVFTGRSGSLGVVNYVEHDYWPHNTALWVREFKKVTPLFALFLLREMNLEQYNGGVSVPTLDRKAVHRVPVLIPPRKFITLFDEHLTPMFTQLRNLRQQNQKLRTARDLLLPRLMSGEITV